ncbi:hypothetical protein C8J57DRAFT_1226404 [Mycena rebaudengoi]|nr:hypothetical protein C8J57DRAFT_1226404 [Mycena rebaudengoi]
MRTKFAFISVILSALLVSQLVGAVPRKIHCSRVRCAAVKCAGGFISVPRPGECCPTCKPRLRPKPKPDCSAVLCFDCVGEIKPDTTMLSNGEAAYSHSETKEEAMEDAGKEREEATQRAREAEGLKLPGSGCVHPVSTPRNL